MIQLERLVIHDVRGIRELEIDLGRESFVVTGPNGSGKSGVVDAIEFGLTGHISRLEGKGSGAISVAKHGPHIGSGIAKVDLAIYLTELKRLVTVTRSTKNPRVVTFNPDTAEIRRAFGDVQTHPELVLSRRQIIDYIIVEATQRSRNVQGLLKMVGIDKTRSVLKSAWNKAKNDAERAAEDVASSEKSLETHLGAEELRADAILSAVNERRRLLGLSECRTLKSGTEFTDGLGEVQEVRGANRATNLREIDQLISRVDSIDETGRSDVEKINADIDVIEESDQLLELITRATFIESGLEFVDSSWCPLCGAEWESEEALKEHLKSVLERAEEAQKIGNRLKRSARALARIDRELQAEIVQVVVAAKEREEEELVVQLETWHSGLEEIAKKLGEPVEIASLRQTFADGWCKAPESVPNALRTFRTRVFAEPDQATPAVAAKFLSVAEERYQKVVAAKTALAKSELVKLRAESAYDGYSGVSERMLSELYEDVEGEFSKFYRIMNGDDEAGFQAKFTQGEGKLDLKVDFYGHGLYPPGAYHSEGHQDGMGVCLYLALMRRLFAEEVRFAVLDDVVMSIDKSHRKGFCRLLRSEFPSTQFVITTHDPVWARLMRSQGLVKAKSMLEFRGWTVETGPLVEEAVDVWERIGEEIGRGDVAAAAGRLRRHLECELAELSDLLGARVRYRSDGDYDLGDLWGGAIGRYGELLRDAVKAAASWGRPETVAAVEQRIEARSQSLQEYGGEAWMLNKMVHYNEWADLIPGEFRGVVDAVRTVMDQMRCQAEEYGSWLFVSWDGKSAQAVRCQCGQINLNLVQK